MTESCLETHPRRGNPTIRRDPQNTELYSKGKGIVPHFSNPNPGGQHQKDKPPKCLVLTTNGD